MISKFRGEIAAHWRRLVLHRNGYVAHLDLTKSPRIEQDKLTYLDMRHALELAQRIYAGYQGERTPAVLSLMFEPSGLRSEPDQFLRVHFELEADE